MMARIEDEELPASEEYIRPNESGDYIPASMALSVVDAKLRFEMGAEKMLSSILEPLRNRYNVIIMANPQLLAMLGLQEFLKTVKKIKSRINDRLAVAGILLTMCDGRTNLSKGITEQVMDTFDGQIRIFDDRIPNTEKVSSSRFITVSRL